MEIRSSSGQVSSMGTTIFLTMSKLQCLVVVWWRQVEKKDPVVSAPEKIAGQQRSPGLGRLIAFVPSGTSLMKGAVAAQFSFLTLDQKSSKYFCKQPKIKLCRQRYLRCKSKTLQAFNTCRRVQVCPQREHALSI